MSLTLEAPKPASKPAAAPAWLTLLLATTCGLVVANLYYAQPLAGPIAESLGVRRGASGLIVTLTQIGYVLGLGLIVPLGDLVENRRLVLTLILVSAAALLAAACSSTPAPYLVATLLVGIGSVAVQVLVPYAAHLAPEASRGRMVGNVMSGLMLGIMLSRPLASFVTHLSSWHAVFFMSAGIMAVLAGVLAITLPKRMPSSGLNYADLLASMAQMLKTTPVLRRRAIYQACLFGAFSLFWTTVPLLLAGPVYRLSQGGIALFALAGVAGSISSPIAGRVADRGWTRPATAVCMLCAIAAFLVSHFMPQGSSASLGLLVVSAIVLDFGVAGNLTLGQRAIFMLGDASRARLNGLYMAIFYVGGAISSAVGGWAFAQGGWSLTTWVGVALPAVALAYFATERR